MEINSRFALWVNKEGRFGVMDVVEGKVYHPLDDGDKYRIRAQQIGMDVRGNKIFTITFAAAENVEVTNVPVSGSSQ